MRQVNLRSVDLNLLVILRQLLLDRHVTRASEQLNMSQPAVSRALQRLRDVFDDPLLVSTQQGYDLSARAQLVLPQLEMLLDGMVALISEPQFDPAKSQREVYICGPEPDTALFLPSFMARLAILAPNMVVNVDSSPQDYFAWLARKNAHFLISSLMPTTNTDQYHRLDLGSFEIVAVMRSDHPLAAGEITPERLAEARHGFVSLTGRGRGMLEKLLSEAGYKAKTALRLTNFTAVPDYCEALPIVFYLPRRYAAQVMRGRDLVLREMPPDIMFRRDRMHLYWHERYHKDPMTIWLREQFRYVFRDMESV